MKRSLLFAILGVIVIIMVVGIFAVNLKKLTVSAAPAFVQILAALRCTLAQRPEGIQLKLRSLPTRAFTWRVKLCSQFLQRA